MWSTAAPSPSAPSITNLSSEQRAALLGVLCSLVFLFMVVVVLLTLYRKLPLCCKIRLHQEPPSDMETPPQYYSSRQTLVSSSEGEQMNHHTGLENISAQTSSLFLIGVPSSYYLPPLEPRFPRLPSYESVRKKDRQRQIHMMIAHRFGLHTSIPDESTSASEAPPTYEESVRQSIQSIDVPFDILTSPEPEAGTDDLPPYDSLHPRTDSSEHSNGGS